MVVELQQYDGHPPRHMCLIVSESSSTQGVGKIEVRGLPHPQGQE